MVSIAYKAPSKTVKGAEIVQIPKDNFPFSYVVTSGAGVTTDNYYISNNIVITGVAVSMNSFGVGFAAVTLRLNGSQVVAQTISSTATIPTNCFMMINLPNWNTSANSLLTSITNCTAGVGQVNITWLGYYK